MTKFIIGKANSDVSEKIRAEIVSLITGGNSAQNIIYIVPDQFEFETEKSVYRALKAQGLLARSEEVHIRTFSSLSDELIKLLGDKKPTADDIAKNIIMHRVIRENKDSLRAFSRIAERPGFCEKMLSTVTMLKTSGISPDDLSDEKLDSENELPDGRKSIRDYTLLRSKLSDVGLIYRSYNARLTKDYFDSLDLTSAAAELITNSGYILFDDAQIFIDGFNDFTISQLHFLTNVIAVADNVTLGFVTEYPTRRDILFSTVNGQISRLKQAAELERVHDIAMCALAGERVAPVERAFVLIDQHAVLVKRLVAVAVELHREQALARAERVGRVDDDEVVFVLDAADVLEAVLIQDMDARIVERARHAGQVLLADRDDALVDLHEVDVLDVLVAAQLADTAAVAAADDKHLFNLLAEHGLDGLACLDRVRKVVVDTRIRNAQPIKQVIAALLLREALFKVFRSSFKYRFANVHFHHPARIARSTTVTSF